MFDGLFCILSRKGGLCIPWKKEKNCLTTEEVEGILRHLLVKETMSESCTRLCRVFVPSGGHQTVEFIGSSWKDLKELFINGKDWSPKWVKITFDFRPTRP